MREERGGRRDKRGEGKDGKRILGLSLVCDCMDVSNLISNVGEKPCDRQIEFCDLSI